MTRIELLRKRVAALEQLVLRKSNALKMASTWFTDYAHQHEGKTPPDTAKAMTNWERASYCDTAANDDGTYVGITIDNGMKSKPVRTRSIS